MAEDLAKAAGVGREIELMGPDGKKRLYKIRPLTMGDLAAFQGHLHDKQLHDAVAITAGMESEERSAFLRQVSGAAVDDEEMQQAMESFDGFQFVLWRALRRDEPKLTIEQVGDMFTIADLQDILPVIQAISGIDENPPQAEAGPEPVTP